MALALRPEGEGAPEITVTEIQNRHEAVSDKNVQVCEEVTINLEIDLI